VHFHEVGAWDSITDVVGVCIALEDLGVDEVVVSSIAVGSGTVRAGHGVLPVPVPAVVALSQGWEVAGVGAGELATPTGMALVTALAARQGPLPPMTVLASGAGAGARDPAERANVVRVVLGMPSGGMTGGGGPAGDLDVDTLTVLEANVDDLDPRVWPVVIARLLDAGAADAWLTPIAMKKGRPGHTLSVLARAADVELLRNVVFAQTSTIGVREVPVRRWSLARTWCSVEVGGTPVRVKVAHRGGRIVHATPEFRDVEAASAVLGRPVREVLEAVVSAASTAGLVAGATLPGPSVAPQDPQRGAAI
jgi:uncharacterized protein (TIGR00299 family) protein